MNINTDMQKRIQERTINEALYMLEHRTTVRDTAKHFNVSKSCTFVDLKKRLKTFNIELYYEIEDMLLINKATRHIRGGESTRKRYTEI